VKIATQSSDSIGDFIKFLLACYSGDVAALDRRGADEQAIAKLALAAGCCLPTYYTNYLREFGANTGRTHVGGDGFATVEMLLEHYADSAEMKHTPPGGVVISTSGLMPNRMLVWHSAGEEPAIGCFSHETVDYILAQSFQHLLFQETWIYSRFVGKSTHVTISVAGPSMVDRARQVVSAAGLKPYWFSDRFGVYAESETSYVCARADDKETVVWIGSQQSSLRASLATEIRAQLGVS
jgi:hypothetical protein